MINYISYNYIIPKQLFAKLKLSIVKFGSGKWDRTTDLGLMSPAL